ncbi:hypothetical protein C8R47DRAFT_1075262 [Mycena vitilis]|nr:hypothetical protein C8R47DRAFT_1075262 [Mycena vitilis]
MSTICDFPNELVSLLIENLSPSTIVLPTRNRTQTDIVGFSQVCARWRAVAHSNHSNHWTTYAIGTFIARAGTGGNLTFSIIHLDHPHTPLHGQIFHAIISTCAGRLFSLQLDVPHEIVNNLCHQSPSPLFPSLAHLAIIGRSQYGQNIAWTQPLAGGFNILRASPVLANLTIGSGEFAPEDLALNLAQWAPPWAQLTSFCAPNVWIRTRDVLTLFAQGVHYSRADRVSPKLTTCDIRVDDEDPSVGYQNSPPTLLRDLHTLSVYFRALYPSFWEDFDAPNLRVLAITSMYDSDEMGWGQDEFMDFKERSDFALEDLSLRFDFTANIDGIIAILNSSPALHRLVLRWTGWMAGPHGDISPLMNRLRVDQRMLWLPNLRVLALDATQQSMTMLQSRCAVQPLDITLYKEAEVTFHPPLSRGKVAALRAMGCSVLEDEMDFYGGLHYR